MWMNPKSKKNKVALEPNQVFCDLPLAAVERPNASYQTRRSSWVLPTGSLYRPEGQWSIWYYDDEAQPLEVQCQPHATNAAAGLGSCDEQKSVAAPLASPLRSSKAPQGG